MPKSGWSSRSADGTPAHSFFASALWFCDRALCWGAPPSRGPSRPPGGHDRPNASPVAPTAPPALPTGSLPLPTDSEILPTAGPMRPRVGRCAPTEGNIAGSEGSVVIAEGRDEEREGRAEGEKRRSGSRAQSGRGGALSKRLAPSSQFSAPCTCAAAAPEALLHPKRLAPFQGTSGPGHLLRGHVEVRPADTVTCNVKCFEKLGVPLLDPWLGR